MSTPNNPIHISAGVQFESQPSLTWYIDRKTMRISGNADGLSAVKQAVDILLNTERFRWQIYSPYSGMAWNGLIGLDPGYVASELQRRALDALMMDDRIRGISDFTYEVKGTVLTAYMSVDTVYGDVQTNVEVTLS